MHKLGLVEPVDEPAHQCPQVRCGGSHLLSVPGNVCQQQTRDAARGATGSVINIAALLRASIRFAVHPRIQAPERYSQGGELAAAPDFHALHLLRRARLHRLSIIFSI